jgi:D-lactate dehydrogenase (cytochrome)
MKSRAEYGLTAFELMSSFSFSLACSHYNKSNPIENNYEWFVLLEISGLESTEAMQGRIEELLMEAYDDELIKDVVITKNLRQAGDLWNLRESIPEAQKRLGGSIKHDVSIPVYRIAEFLEVAEKAISQVLPEAKFCTFGHLGDGSIHYNLVQPSNMTESCFFKHTEKVNTIVHDIVDQFEGSFSAEHGIGLMKREELNRRKDPVELDLMYKLKAAIDPLGIMNPGKMLTRRHSPLDR